MRSRKLICLAAVLAIMSAACGSDENGSSPCLGRSEMTAARIGVS